MSKNVFTKRSELVCGKLDELVQILIQMDSVRGMDLVRSIRNDVQRMENKLAERKYQAEEYVKMLSEILLVDVDITKEDDERIKEFKELLNKTSQIGPDALNVRIR